MKNLLTILLTLAFSATAFAAASTNDKTVTKTHEASEVTAATETNPTVATETTEVTETTTKEKAKK